MLFVLEEVVCQLCAGSLVVPLAALSPFYRPLEFELAVTPKYRRLIFTLNFKALNSVFKALNWLIFS